MLIAKYLKPTIILQLIKIGRIAGENNEMKKQTVELKLFDES